MDVIVTRLLSILKILYLNPFLLLFLKLIAIIISGVPQGTVLGPLHQRQENYEFLDEDLIEANGIAVCIDQNY
jgi:hypothetical protein